MIKANELRKGNYLLNTGEDGGIIKVSEIHRPFKGRTSSSNRDMGVSYNIPGGGYGSTSLEEDEDMHPDEYLIQPIPLTEEWYLRFGFEKLCKVYWVNDDIEIKILKNQAYAVTADLGEYIISEEFHYVHELQNIHHSLIKKELEIKQIDYNAQGGYNSPK